MNVINQCLWFALGCGIGLGPLSLGSARAEQDHHVDFSEAAITLESDCPSCQLGEFQSLHSSMTDDRDLRHSSQTEFDYILAQLGGPPSDLTDPLSLDLPGSAPRLKRQPESTDQPLFRPRSDILLERGSRYAPSITLLSPSAFGKDWREYSAGIGFQHRTRFTNTSDGAFGVGVGLGDSTNLVGLDIGITFTDLTEFFDRGIVSFKLHRRLMPDLAIAVGVNDALTWGDGDVDGPSPYGAISKIFRLREDSRSFMSQISVSAGVGTGRYRSESSIFNRNGGPNPFGGVALRVFDPVNVITEWSGQDLSVGLSVRPIPHIPLVITPAVTDLTGTAGDGARFLLGVGYASRF